MQKSQPPDDEVPNEIQCMLFTLRMNALAAREINAEQHVIHGCPISSETAKLTDLGKIYLDAESCVSLILIAVRVG